MQNDPGSPLYGARGTVGLPSVEDASSAPWENALFNGKPNPLERRFQILAFHHSTPAPGRVPRPSDSWLLRGSVREEISHEPFHGKYFLFQIRLAFLDFLEILQQSLLRFLNNILLDFFWQIQIIVGEHSHYILRVKSQNSRLLTRLNQVF